MVLATLSATGSHYGVAKFLQIPRESSGAAQAPLPAPWTCCGSPGAAERRTPSRGHRCSLPHVKLEIETVKCQAL